MITYKDLLNKLKIISEAKQVGDLYHYTDARNANKILSSNTLKVVHNVEPNVSTTRNKNLHKTGKITATGLRNFVPIHVSFVLDGDKISNHYKIKPYNDYNKSHKDFVDSKTNQKIESEETISGDLHNVKDYIKKIRVHKKLEPKDLEELKSHNIPIEHVK